MSEERKPDAMKTMLGMVIFFSLLAAVGSCALGFFIGWAVTK